MRKWALAIAASFLLLVLGCNNPLPPTTPFALDHTTLLGIVTQAAEDNHVAAALVLAVLEAESAGNPNAVSSHGAMGLMQLMPATAATCGLRRPFDPHDNVECGASYLSQMLARFHDVTLAVAAYNAGPNAVARAHGVPSKAQSYVNRVLTLYQSFAAAAPP